MAFSTTHQLAVRDQPVSEVRVYLRKPSVRTLNTGLQTKWKKEGWMRTPRVSSSFGSPCTSQVTRAMCEKYHWRLVYLPRFMFMTVSKLWNSLAIAFNTKVGMIFPWLWLITTISVSTVRSVHLIRLSHDARNRKPYWVWIIKQKVSNNTTISLQGEPIHHQLVIIAETAFLPLVYIALARVNVI